MAIDDFLATALHHLRIGLGGCVGVKLENRNGVVLTQFGVSLQSLAVCAIVSSATRAMAPKSGRLVRMSGYGASLGSIDQKEAPMTAAYEVLSQDELTVERCNSDLSGASPEEILKWALQTFGEAFCITTSLADAALVDMASQIRPGVHVVFVDTGYHFAETLQTRAKLIERYAIHLVSALPGQTVAEQDAEHSPALFERDADLCCRLRKIEPINAALTGYRAWASGIRRDETSARSTVGVVEWDAQRAMVKVNPLANWTQADVDAYIEDHDVLVNPLRAEGYPSIGCFPCTRPAAPGADIRSGRWVGLQKTECGLHTG